VGATFLPEQLYLPCESGLDGSRHADDDQVDLGGDEEDEVEEDEVEEEEVEEGEGEGGDQVSEAVGGAVAGGDEGAHGHTLREEEAQALARREAEELEAAEAAAAAAAAAQLEEQQQQAAVRVQCLARGTSSRSRVLRLRQLAQEQAQAQAQAARVPPPIEEEDALPDEAPLPPEPSRPVLVPSPDKRPKRPPPKKPTQPAQPLQDLKVDLVINGTEVAVQGQFVADGLVLHATEAQEQLQTRLVLSEADVGAAMRQVLGDEATFRGILGAESAGTEGAHVDAIMANNNAQFTLFVAVCDALDLFLSRKNGVMTLKYRPPVFEG
jgi:hypothetical protein